MAPVQCAKRGRESDPSTVVLEQGRCSHSEKKNNGASIVQQLSRGLRSNFLQKLLAL